MGRAALSTSPRAARKELHRRVSALAGAPDFTYQEAHMAVPAPTHPCWQRLAGGALSRLKTEHLGTQLMTKRLERSTDPVSVKASQIHAYFAKWERALPNEVQQLASL
jgi:hypothetical protein